MSLASSACPPFSSNLGGGSQFEFVSCSDIYWAELFEIDCPITGDATSLSLDCTFTDDNGVCSTTYHVQGTGTKTGDTWTINGTQSITSETPAGCSGDPTCEQVTITVVEQGVGPPSACQYGDPNTVALTVTGGPLGNVVLDAGGFPTQGTIGWQWDINAFFSTSGPAPASALNMTAMSMSIPEVSSANLPQSFPVTIPQPVGASLQTQGGLNVTMGYIESYTSGGGYSAESAGSGMVTVYEVSDQHIAGDYTVSTSGTQYIPSANPTTSTRGLNGEFHVRTVPLAAAMRYPAWLGIREAIKLAHE